MWKGFFVQHGIPINTEQILKDPHPSPLPQSGRGNQSKEADF